MEKINNNCGAIANNRGSVRLKLGHKFRNIEQFEFIVVLHGNK